MSCKHPLIKAETSERIAKANDGHMYKKVQIIKPDDNLENLESFMHTHPNWKYTIIPCKKCIGCRLDYARQWANRGYLESQHWEQNYFVTLTYNDENLPENGSLEPKEFTLFIKRLRQEMRDKGYQNEGIRFMGCGEYGEQRERPHYHIIFFNLNLPLDSFYNARIINKNTYWQNRIIEKCWNKGISNISSVTWNNIAYTARYITKKINGEKEEETYAGKEKEFFRTSRNPGIAAYYFEENMEKIYANDEIIVKNRAGTISSKPPKYFDRLLEKIDEEQLKTIKRERQKRQRTNMKVKGETTSNTQLEQLAIEERTLTDKTMKLIRELEKQR